MIRNTFKAALTDLSSFSGTMPDCGELMCKPVWTVPLATEDTSHYVEARVSRLLTNPPVSGVRRYFLFNPFFTDKFIFGSTVPFPPDAVTKLRAKGKSGQCYHLY